MTRDEAIACTIAALVTLWIIWSIFAWIVRRISRQEFLRLARGNAIAMSAKARNQPRDPETKRWVKASKRHRGAA